MISKNLFKKMDDEKKFIEISMINMQWLSNIKII